MQHADLMTDGYDFQVQHEFDYEATGAFVYDEESPIDLLFYFICTRVFGSIENIKVRIAGRNLRELIRRVVANVTVYEIGHYSEGFRFPGCLPEYIESCKCLEVLCTIYDSKRKPLSFTLVEISGRPTFCKLKLLASELSRSHPIFQLCVLENGEYYLHTGKLQATQYRQLIGLPLPNAVAGTDVHKYDTEFKNAIHCSTWPAQAFSMIQRQKRNDWPKQTSIENIIRQGCFVVVSDDQRDPLEFRLSFDLAVRELVQSFNQCQYNVLGLILMFIYETFQEHLRKIISLAVKHCMFWVIHDQPSAHWDEFNLNKCLAAVAEKIIDALEQSWCQSFFVRNCDVFDGSMVDRTVADSALKHFRELKSSGLRYFFRFLQFISFRDLLRENTETAIEKLCSEDVSYQTDFSLFQEVAQTVREYRRILLKQPSMSTIFILEKHILDHCGPNINHDMLRIVLDSSNSIKASFLLRRLLGKDTGNKERLQIQKNIKILLASRFDLAEGHLKLATFMLFTRKAHACRNILTRVRASLSLSSIILSRCYTVEGLIEPPLAVLESYRKATKGEKFSLKEKMLYYVLYGVEFTTMDLAIVPKPVRHELESRGGETLLLDPLIYATFLEILCSIIVDRPEVTRLHVTSFNEMVSRRSGSTQYHVYLNLLGYCLHLTGQKQEARRFFEISLRAKSADNAASRHVRDLDW